ncbi:hypothetical protein KAR91_58700 [Candidatus Pacearchaeota archaeon]|nr:hypothetical protein [Candidatus Pacearchaeota archaeon]
MTWEIQIRYDADQDDVGSISATWTDQEYGDFTFSDRIKSNQTGANAFIAEAIAARDVWQVKQAASAVGVVWVLGQINTTDPKVGA